MAQLTELNAAIRAAVLSPHNAAGWALAEELAGALDRPDDLIAAYGEALKTRPAADIAELIGERARQFCDEWFGDDATVLEGLLRQVFAYVPTSEATLQRLAAICTSQERWDELLALYDQALAVDTGEREPGRQIVLLREAAQLAKDVANRPEKAITYQQQLLRLTPDDPQLLLGLERLLERHARWKDLIALWESRLDAHAKRDREKSRLRIAQVWLDDLVDTSKSLAAVRPLLSDVTEAETEREACGLVTRLIEHAKTPRAVRDQAVESLRSHYEALGREREVIALLERVIAIDPNGSRPLRQEAAQRLADVGELAPAMDHLVALLAATPESVAVEDKLRSLAEQSGDFGRYAHGVAQAAARALAPTRAVELYAKAAKTHVDRLADAAAAIALYEQAAAIEQAAEGEQLLVLRRLNTLYAQVGRQADRLGVLERQAELEAADGAKAMLYTEAARLAETLGEADRALVLWAKRPSSAPDDTSGLDARIALLTSQKRWDELVRSLEERVAKQADSARQRTDLETLAHVHQHERHDAAAAIVAWQRILAMAPDDIEAIAALVALFETTERWAELVELLERSTSREVARAVDQYHHLGAALRGPLADRVRATAAFARALRLDPAYPPAREALLASLDDAETNGPAGAALAVAYQQTNDLAGALALMPSRLAQAEARQDRAAILALRRESAMLRQTVAKDLAGALVDLCAALPLAPTDPVLGNDVLALAEKTGEIDAVVAAFEAALVARTHDAPHDAIEPMRLRLALAGFLRRRAAYPERALALYQRVLATVPDHRAAALAVIELAGELNQVPPAVQAVLGYAMATERYDEAMWQAARSACASVENLLATTAAHEGLEALPHSVAAQFYWQLAEGWRGLGEAGKQGETLVQALRLGGERAPWLRTLASLYRQAEAGEALVRVLLRLAAVEPTQLEPVIEAAERAVELAKAQPEPLDAGLAELTQQALLAVYNRASSGWRAGQLLEGRGLGELTKWAVLELAALYRQRGRSRAALDLLAEAAGLPFETQERRALRMLAAEIAATELRDRPLAIDMLRGVASLGGADHGEVLERLARFLLEEGRVAELWAVRQEQLALPMPVEARVRLRLDSAHLVALIEQRGGRLQALLANLQELPGHDDSLQAAIELLTERGQYPALVDLLERQAAQIEAQGQTERAATVWETYASIAELQTKQPERAIAAHRRVVALTHAPGSLHALARLNLERGQPAAAIPWLENLLASAHGEARNAAALQLVRAYADIGDVDRAMGAAEQYFNPAAPSMALLALLCTMYREREAWEPLAKLITKSLPEITDATVRRAYAREAADIFVNQLGQHAKALPALESALALDPTDRELRTQLAMGLRAAGRLDEARLALGTLISEFGRRHSVERGALHGELALVAQQQGNDDEAITELELAAKMDASNIAVHRRLAELSRKRGQLEKAERAYRALLLIVRRQPPGEDVQAIGQSEVLYELHRLAQGRGDGDQAKELLESALDAAGRSDAEVRRLRRSLFEHGDSELLLTVLDQRLRASTEAEAQAMLLADMADLQARLGRIDEALATYLRALALAPSREGLHEQARALAKTHGKTAAFVDGAEALVDKLRRKDDPPLIAAILLRAGEAMEFDAANLDAAAALYRRAEATGERVVEAYAAQARVAAAQGDIDEQTRILDRMFELAGPDNFLPFEQGKVQPAQIDVLYRLAEIFVVTDARRVMGINLLERAFAAEPRWLVAGRILRVAAQTELAETDERVMPLFERVARAAHDNALLLDFLERQATLPGASAAAVREAVDVATELGEHARAEALLERAVVAARNSVMGIGADGWSALALAERRLVADDVTMAADLMVEIAPAAESSQIDDLGKRIASAAKRLGRPTVAATVYEFLRERRPEDPDVWQPLLELYREQRDADRLADVVVATLAMLRSPTERNQLRMTHAAFLDTTLGRTQDAMEVLREGLHDNPDDVAVAGAYEDLLRKQGDEDAIIDYLWQRFDDSQRRGTRDAVVDVALRLGQLLDAKASPDAARVYRSALMAAPDDKILLGRVVAHIQPEDDRREAAVLMERLLAVTDAAQRPALAMRVAETWREAGDVAAVRRTLEAAEAAHPEHVEIHDALERFYRDRAMWKEVAELMIRDAARLADDDSVEKLRQAASVYMGLLHQPMKAAEVLAAARARAPQNYDLVTAQADALAAGGDLDGAQRAIGEALDTAQGDERVNLLMQRAMFRQQLGDEANAVEELEQAYALAPLRVGPALLGALERWRTYSREIDALPAERLATLRLAELSIGSGELARARNLLLGWIERDRNDAATLQLLCEVDANTGNWEGVYQGMAKLADITSGEAQVTAAQGALDAATKAGHPVDAIAIIEVVHQAQPAVAALRDHLRAWYEAQGLVAELAAVLVADGDHGEAVPARQEAYRRAAELQLYTIGNAQAATYPAGKALELAPDNAFILMLNVDILLAAGQVEAASATLEAAIAAHKKRTPELAVMQQRMARVCALLSDQEGQLNWLKKAFDVDRKNSEVAAELAHLATELGDYELALKPLRAITLMDNPQPITRPMALLWEAKIEHARGNKAKAELWAKKALREDPNFGDAQQFIEELAQA